MLGKSVHIYKSRSKAIVYDFVEKTHKKHMRYFAILIQFVEIPEKIKSSCLPSNTPLSAHSYTQSHSTVYSAVRLYYYTARGLGTFTG